MNRKIRKLVLINFIVLLSSNVNAQWIQQNSGTVNDLAFMSAPSNNVAYINSYGSLLKTTNGGTNWNVIPGVSFSSGAPILFTAVDTGYMTGVGGILKTVDGGANWIDNFSYNIGNTNSSCFSFLNSNTGFAVCLNLAGDSLLIFKTINAGNSWSFCGNYHFNASATSLYFTSPSIGYMVLEGFGVFKTTDGGASWLPNLITTDAMFVHSVFFPSPAIGYAVGADSTYKTTDGGNTWNQMTNINTLGNISVYFSDDNHGYCVGGDGFSQGAIIKTIDGGTNWTLEATPIQTLYSVSFPNSNVGYACGTNGAIYKLDLGIGINDIAKDDELTMYPNPATNELTIESKMQNAEIEIRDVLGQMVYSTKAIASSSTIDVSMLSKGVYFISLQNGKQTINKKLVKE